VIGINLFFSLGQYKLLEFEAENDNAGEFDGEVLGKMKHGLTSENEEAVPDNVSAVGSLNWECQISIVVGLHPIT